MTEPKKPTRTPRFEPGGKVRVRYGVTVPDFEDIPLGGWAGVVTGVEQFDDQIEYEVEWDRRTLDGLHPVYLKRCERDDLDVETMCLTEEDIEPDDGTPVPIEQPTAIKTPALSEKDEEDRVRAVFGLTHDDPLPEISLETLLAYHRYLAGHLKFPFTAYCGEEEIGPFSRKRATMSVTGLIDLDGDVLDLEDGLFCTGRDRGDEVVFPLADIQVRSKKKDPNSRMISDYAYWFHNWPFLDVIDTDRGEFDEDDEPDQGDFDEDDEPDQGEFDEDDEPGIPPPTLRLFIKAILVCGVGDGVIGATIGAALRTLNGAGTASMIGGVPLGMIGMFLLGRHGMAVGAVNRLRFVAVLTAIFGLVGGGLVGVVAGLTLVALPWSILGLLVGMFFGPYLLPQKQRRWVSFRVASLGTCVGILVSAFRHDQARATAGAFSGAITALAVAVGLILFLVGAVYLKAGRPTGHELGDEEPVEFGEEGEEDEDDGGGGGLRLRRF